MWCIPEVNGEYVARMEDVLDLYAEAPDPERPVICFDETPAHARPRRCHSHCEAVLVWIFIDSAPHPWQFRCVKLWVCAAP
jgi:hypothetical protein